MPRPRRPREDYICGTYPAYQAHIKRGERGREIDEACTQANRDYNNERRRGKADREYQAKYREMERRAFLRLVELHKSEFLEILLEEQWNMDHPPVDKGTEQ
jgi:hypothetical protein